jgi:two-component system nitrate/nitrite response regulator NarL
MSTAATTRAVSHVRILLAHDQPLFRDSLTRLLEQQSGFVVVGGAPVTPEAAALAGRLRPDVMIVDMSTPAQGLDVLRRVRVPTMMLAAAAQSKAQTAALQSGARGIVLKENATIHLFAGVRAVAANLYWLADHSTVHLDGGSRQIAPRALRVGSGPFNLTRREIEIVGGVASAESNRDIAERLAIAEVTVKHHLSHVFDKLGVFSRLELAIFALSHGLVEGGARTSGATEPAALVTAMEGDGEDERRAG